MPRKSHAHATWSGDVVAVARCGVDEAGRGPLAGAVYAAAVILDPARPIAGLADSKVLSEARRHKLEADIHTQARAHAVAFASVAEIDVLNILNASLLAMQRAVEALARTLLPDEVMVDGLHVPTFSFPIAAHAVVEGDRLIAEISAASILAKNARDREMVKMELRYPGYGFAQHKGYGTRAHLAALQALGPTPIHRTSFRPVREAAAQARMQFAEVPF